MRVGDIIAEIMKRERIQNLHLYAITAVSEYCAAADIRPMVTRQERIACAMADAQGRLSSGDDVKVFACQAGPGIENAFGGVAQAFSEGVPLVIVVPGPAPNLAFVPPSFNATLNYEHITKSIEAVTDPNMIVPAMRRAFTLARNGRPGPCMIELQGTLASDVPSIKTAADIDYQPTKRTVLGPDPKDIEAAADALLKAKMPIIYAGQGVHYAKAWPELRQVVELLEIPIGTTMEGKSCFPETHPLSLGAGGRTLSRAFATHIRDSDLVFGLGTSFTSSGYCIRWPTAGKKFIHNTVDERDLDKNLPANYPILGDAKLTCAMLYQALSSRLKGKPRGLAKEVGARIAAQNEPWMKEWMPYLTSDAKPLSPYRVLYELTQAVDMPNTIFSGDAGSGRDEPLPFWKTVTPITYIGWGKTTQLGYGLGLVMGAKIAHPEKLCMNYWGDAAFGMTGMDLETCARLNIPIMSVVSNNFAMKCEFAGMKLSHEKYRTCDISGNYADLAKALGCYSERVTDAGQVAHAIQNGIRATKEGKPVLLEFITTQEVRYSNETAILNPGGPATGGGDDD